MTKKYLFPSAALTLLLLSEIPAFAYGGGRGSPADGAMHGTVVKRKVEKRVAKRALKLGKTNKSMRTRMRHWDSAASTSSISIENFSFSPLAIQVKKGTTVTWTNNDMASHTIKGWGFGPPGPPFGHGQTYSYTFDAEGTFTYNCELHPTMVGRVEVMP